MSKRLKASDYKILLNDIKQRIKSAQYEALKAVNKELISLYWDIGRTIIEKQKGKTWGKSIVEQLAKDLQKEFPGISGFSSSNLWRMHNFYGYYAKNEKLAPLVREIGWSHNIMIMEKCHDAKQREFYLRMTRKFRTPYFWEFRKTPVALFRPHLPGVHTRDASLCRGSAPELH